MRATPRDGCDIFACTLMAPRAIRTLITAIFVFVSTVLAAEGWAAGPPATRACSTTDLDGIYRLVDFREIPSRSFTHQMEMAPYDFLGFYSGSVWGNSGVQHATGEFAQSREGPQ